MKVKIVDEYKVDREGTVYSKQTGLPLAPATNKYGYKVVGLWENGKQSTYTVHRLVALAFIPNPDNKPCVNHIDGDKGNNLVSNLEWCTYSENTLHALENKLKIPEQGEDVHNASITNDQAHEICKLLIEGFRYKDISEKIGTTKEVVSFISLGRTWRHVSDAYKLPKQRRGISEETVRWVCRQIEKGYRNKEIVDMSTNPMVNKSTVTRIKNKKSFASVASEYSF